MTARTHSDDFRLEGVICPPRVCRLIAPTLVRDLRAAFSAYGKVDPELALWVRAVESEGSRWASCGDASPGADRLQGPSQSKHELLTAADVAEVLGCTASAVRDAVARGRLVPARRRPYMFDRSEVDRYQSTRRGRAS